MAVIRLGILAVSCALGAPALAACPLGPPEPPPAAFSASPPPPPDAALRPVRPDCLAGLSGPERENCPRAEIAAYGETVDAWVAALNEYVEATHRYANEAARFANASVAHARAARDHADEALEFARCEAGAIAGAAGE